jgi:peptidoglycan lytic transglycosylase
MRRLRRSILAVLAAALVPAAPAAASGTGGATYTAAGPVTLVTKPAGLVGRPKVFKGTVSKHDAGRTVAVERYDEISRQWTVLVRATAGPRGGFKARWTADRAGLSRVRARIDGARAQTAATTPEVDITLFRAQRATWYGPGLYGNQTACGRTLTRTLVGVAHRKLPCGARVEFLYNGRRLTVPVVDRGPFANGAKWDLTAAAAERLGFTGVDTVGALRARR